MTWVLIIVARTYAESGRAIAVTTQEFNSEKACRAAAEAMHKQFDFLGAGFDTICVPKGTAREDYP